MAAAEGRRAASGESAGELLEGSQPSQFVASCERYADAKRATVDVLQDAARRGGSDIYIP